MATSLVTFLKARPVTHLLLLPEMKLDCLQLMELRVN